MEQNDWILAINQTLAVLAEHKVTGEGWGLQGNKAIICDSLLVYLYIHLVCSRVWCVSDTCKL